jgi:hypothetical protein
MENNSHDESYTQLSQDDLARIKRREVYITETKEWMEKNVDIQKYLSKYSEANATDFINDYAQDKALWLEYGPFYSERNLEKDLRWTESAWEGLALIQQKKLFDAQCLWRAEKLNIPNLKVCFEFTQWEKNVMNCPFISPITEDDIQLYASFLNSLNPETELGWFEGWQDYDELKEAYNEESETRNFPEWYDYYNTYRGTSGYMLLPDVRGAKEERYSDVARKKNWQDYLIANPDHKDPPPYNPNDYLSYYNRSQRNDFIEQFESADHKYLYKEFQRAHGEHTKIEHINLSEFVFTLEELEETFPVEAHHDYKQALMKGYRKHCYVRQAQHLKYAFEQYEMNRSIGIDQPGELDYLDEIREKYVQDVLNGRKLLGEPENFDYLEV